MPDPAFTPADPRRSLIRTVWGVLIINVVLVAAVAVGLWLARSHGWIVTREGTTALVLMGLVVIIVPLEVLFLLRAYAELKRAADAAKREQP